MNSRPQGGSVIVDGRIELMQNRRMNKDDWRGMGEPLNETDANGNGISVPATYYVQLFNRSQRKSLQRVMQQRMDQPAQTFFSFFPQQGLLEEVPAVVKGELGKSLARNGLTSEMKFELYPMGANQILMRIENLADLFDGELQYQQVNVHQLAKEIFMIANNNEFNVKMMISETTLTANQLYSDMAHNRLKWKTVDDPAPALDEIDFDFTRVKFQQQRIRTFKINYVLHDDQKFL